MSTFNLSTDLFPHQREDVNRLLSNSDNYLNLSEMGVGKTAVAIGLAVEGKYETACIICPKTLRLEWKRQIEDWTGIVPLISNRGTYDRLLPLAYNLQAEVYNPFFAVNYETFRSESHLELLNKYPFDLIILDEVHRLRNPYSKMTKGMQSFIKAHPHARVLGITGSPIVNHPGDLHTVLSLIRPEEFGKWNRTIFTDRYSALVKKTFLRCYSCRHLSTRLSSNVCPKCGSTNLGYFTSHKYEGGRNLDELRLLTSSYTIRRTKAEALPWLPEKYRRKVPIEMSSQQRTVYKQMEDELFVLLDSGDTLWSAGVLSRLTRLRQLNLDPRILGINCEGIKTSFIKEFIEGTNEKVVIFSCFKEYIDLLAKELDCSKMVLTGNTPADDRIPMAMKFNSDDTKVFMSTIGPSSPGGEGLTLTGASTVIFPDRWWTPTTNTQAEDRLHRITQKNAVQVITPICEKSIDQSLDKILERKKAYGEGYLGEDDNIKEVIDDLRRSRSEKVEEEEEDKDEAD